MEAALDAQARLLAQPGRVHVRDHPAACAATGLLPVRRRAHSCDSPGQPRRHPPRQRPRPTPDPHAHAPDGEAPGAFAHDKLDAYRIACELAALANKIGAQIPRGPRNIADQLLRSASNPVLLLAEGGLSGSARRQYNNTARGRARARAGEECGVARGAWHVERGAWRVRRVSRAVVTRREPTRGGWARELGWCRWGGVCEQLRHENPVRTCGARN
jgi:hypothetical protein